MKPELIILHHSLTKDSRTVSWDAIRRYHVGTNHWSDIGYHFGIERIEDTFEVLVGRMPDRMGAHCRGQNSRSLGICFVGNYDMGPPPPEMWVKGLGLVRSLMNVFGIPADRVRGHCDFADKTCPGKAFGMDRFRAGLVA